MLIGFRELLEERRSRGAAAGAFTCYTLTTAVGVLRAAEAEEAPVILLVSEASYAAPEGPLLLAALGAAAERANSPACVQVDHVADPAAIARALADAGPVQGVMPSPKTRSVPASTPNSTYLEKSPRPVPP